MFFVKYEKTTQLPSQQASSRGRAKGSENYNEENIRKLLCYTLHRENGKHIYRLSCADIYSLLQREDELFNISVNK